MDDSLGEEFVPKRPVATSEPYVAHTPGTALPDKWHLFREHALGTAALAGEFAAAFGAELLVRFVALVHDIGKLAAEVQLAFQRCAVSGGRLGVPHKVEGAAMGGLFLGLDNLRAAKIVASVNFGHHNHIPDEGHQTMKVLREMLREPDRIDEYVALADSLLDVDLRAMARDIRLPDFSDDVDTASYRAELFTRMCHSALVDADFLDTAAHFASSPSPHRHADRGMTALRDAFFDYYEARFSQAQPTELNLLRADLFDRCVRAGADPQLAASRRIFRLPAQTGSGKTMAAAAFALTHAVEHGKRRVVVAVPFTSITTQNAAEYREAFSALGDDVVLEHHSDIVDEDQAETTWRRLSAQNWDAEFVVTTTVQLFESLFSNKPAATRKLHRLANSVVVLDEVQALPLRLVPSILRMLRQLTEDYGVTVLLASATQPTFWELPQWQGEFDPIDIADINEVPRATQRVTYEVRTTPQTWDEIAAEIAELPSVLVIVNTTQDAQDLHRRLEELDPDSATFHLSTRMCGQHRLDVLQEVRRRLAAGEPTRLVSTQLIEAGVNVDFPALYRAVAPAEAIVQSGGRSNREGKLPGRGGRVVVFIPVDAAMPSREYAELTRRTRNLFVSQPDSYRFDDPAALASYYVEVMAHFHAAAKQTESVEVDAARRAFNFPEVRAKFQMIEDDSLTVLVTDYGTGEDRARVRALYDALTDPTYVMTGADYRLAARFSAQIPKRWVEREPVIATRVAGVHVWAGEYDDARGLVFGAGGFLA